MTPVLATLSAMGPCSLASLSAAVGLPPNVVEKELRAAPLAVYGADGWRSADRRTTPARFPPGEERRWNSRPVAWASVLRALKEDGGAMTMAEIKDEAGKSPRLCAEALHALVAAGEIVEVVGGWVAL